MDIHTLHEQLRAKEAEIKSLLSQAGLRSDEEMENLIEQHAEAIEEGDSPAQWLSREKKIISSEIGRLLTDRYEIEQQILDAQDDG